MKEVKNNMKIYYIIGLIIIISIVVFFVLKNNHPKLDIASIEYSYRSNYGSIIDNSKKYVSVDSNGNVKLSNEYNPYVEEYSISKDKFIELENYVNERNSIVYSGVSGNNNVYDGGSSQLIVVLKDGKKYVVGGSNVENSKYTEIISKIDEIVGEDIINAYRKKLNTIYDEKHIMLDDAKKLISLAKKKVNENKDIQSPHTFTLEELNVNDDIKPTNDEYDIKLSTVTYKIENDIARYCVTLIGNNRSIGKDECVDEYDLSNDKNVIDNK